MVVAVGDKSRRFTDQDLNKSAALFLDRDGVLNVDRGYVFRPRDLELCAGVAEGLKRLAVARPALQLIVISNQSGIGRGYFSIQDTVLFHEELNRQLVALGAPKITAFLFCPHLPDSGFAEFSGACSCRKPSSGMLVLASQRFGLNLVSSFLIGDRSSDIEAATNAGVRGIQVRSSKHTQRHPQVWATVDNFQEAVDRILGAGPDQP